MKNWIARTTKVGTAAVIIATFLFSCQDDLTPKKLSGEEQAKLTAQDHAQMLIATQEALDITAGALEDKGVAEGRIKQGAGVDQFGCAPSVNLTLNVDRNHPDSIIYFGSISINYGNGSSCDAENKRMGKLTNAFRIIVSTRNKIQFSSTETITFEEFTTQNNAYNGSIVVTSANGKKTTVEGNKFATNFEDGTSSSWSGKLVFAYEDVLKKKGELKISGSINGTSRQSTNYTAAITEDVIFKNGCQGSLKKIPVDGKVSITTDAVGSVVDYGNGTCDKTYTVTVDGQATTYSFK